MRHSGSVTRSFCNNTSHSYSENRLGAVFLWVKHASRTDTLQPVYADKGFPACPCDCRHTNRGIAAGNGSAIYLFAEWKSPVKKRLGKGACRNGYRQFRGIAARWRRLESVTDCCDDFRYGICCMGWTDCRSMGLWKHLYGIGCWWRDCLCRYRSGRFRAGQCPDSGKNVPVVIGLFIRRIQSDLFGQCAGQ